MIQINYDRLKEIVFILWDNEQDFNDEKTQRRITGKLFKDTPKRCYSMDEFKDILSKYDPNQEFLFFIHLAHTNDQAGHYSFINSGILGVYPNINRYYVTRSDLVEVQEKNKLGLDIYSWENYQAKIGTTFKPQTVSEMMEQSGSKSVKTREKERKRPLLRYAIFTALFEEFKEVDELFEWDDNLKEETNTTVYRIGKFKGTETYAVACFAGKTGMTEAAVICSELINRYTPDYIFMPGVCGGSDKTEFGDVIVASKVFLLGKGKLKDETEEIKGKKQKVKLHYKGEVMDLNQVTNTEGKPVRIVAEVFENETETIEMDDKLKQKLEPKLKHIEGKINIPYKTKAEKINVRLDPMACSLSVIDKEDYFEYEIQGRDRKTKAVEMESYGVARAAQKANGGSTDFLIFKSVMDKTKLKTDDYKEKAAFTSAQFLKYLIEDEIL